MVWKLAKVQDADVTAMNQLVAGTSYGHNGKNMISINNVSGFKVTEIVNLVGKYFTTDFYVEVLEREFMNLKIRITGANPNSTMNKLRALFPAASK